jgi:tripartite-type tricarboxylate transporter receptor subunit TctC
MKQYMVSVLAACLLAMPALAQSQQYPTKPVKVIVTTVPGPLDTFARIVCDKISIALKQPFIIENRAGAGGNIGADLVAKSPADGYTLLFAIDTTFTVNPAVYKALPFDPVKDFATISVPVTYGQLLAVHPAVPAKSVAELVALAKQKTLTYASGGSGSPSHLSSAYFLATAGIDMTHIPYKGTGQSVIDVVAGQVDTIFAVVTGVLPQVKAGKLRALAISSAKRSALAPDVPTIAESGYPGFDVSFAYAFMAPAGTPDEIVQLLAREVQHAMAQSDVQEKMRTFDYVTTGMDPKHSAAWLKENRGRWTGVVERAGITAN